MQTTEHQTLPDDGPRHGGGPFKPAPPPGADQDASGAQGRFFGYPDQALVGTWTVRDVQAFLRVSERKARDVMRADGAPPPLRLGSDRCDRWNPYQVVAWLHGRPDAAGGPPPRPVPDAPDASDAPAAGAPGRQWSPSPARAGARTGRRR